jgi:hypothetical protein
MFKAQYIGGEFVYAFLPVGVKCGPASRQAVVTFGSKAAWMSSGKFFVYDGTVEELPSEVGDYVFGRLNRAQASKVSAQLLSDFSEIVWYYPSTSGTENDSAVIWNYATDTWRLEAIPRASGCDRGFLEFPLAAAPNGAVYEHEKGTTYQDTGGSAYVPYAESGTLELGEGDNVITVFGMVPDERTLGESNARFYGRFSPTGSETTFGPFTMAYPTTFIFETRQLRMRVTQVTGGWRVGTPKLDVIPGGVW